VAAKATTESKASRELQDALGLQAGAASPRRRTHALTGMAVLMVSVIAIAVLLLAGGDAAPATPTGSVTPPSTPTRMRRVRC
jgi:hypothetical protein